ncbi:MAG: inositol monophosphatase [bacterium]|nr:inositol monophosphatase [bacterium]
MEKLYKQIIDQVIKSGQRIKIKAGNIKDIGVKKRFLTEEDQFIERELKSIIIKKAPDHLFCAEEENEKFIIGEDVWVVDPISGTRSLIDGNGWFGIVVSHIHKGQSVFGIVYDVLRNELFVAENNRGTLLNNKKIFVNHRRTEKPRIILRVSYSWPDIEKSKKITKELEIRYNLEAFRGSMGVSDCQVACGRIDGIIDLTKDSFPHFASSLIVQEAGGIYTNYKGEEKIEFEDRIFIGGNKIVQPDLLKTIKKYYEIK